MLWELGNHYTWKAQPKPIPAPAPSASVPQPVSSDIPSATPVSERETLRDSYRAAFPDVKIADICWAAQQTYREWRRWINGEAKDGLKPDRAFRRVLTSGKKPEELRKQPRPTKYNG